MCYRFLCENRQWTLYYNGLSTTRMIPNVPSWSPSFGRKKREKLFLVRQFDGRNSLVSDLSIPKIRNFLTYEKSPLRRYNGSEVGFPSEKMKCQRRISFESSRLLRRSSYVRKEPEDFSPRILDGAYMRP